MKRETNKIWEYHWAKKKKKAKKKKAKIKKKANERKTKAVIV